MRRTIVKNTTPRGPPIVSTPEEPRQPPAPVPAPEADNRVFEPQLPEWKAVPAPPVVQAAPVLTVSNPTPLNITSDYTPAIETFPSLGESYFLTAASVPEANWSRYPALQNIDMAGYDIDHAGKVVAADVTTGEVKAHVAIPDSKFLNDVTCDGAKAYVSDMMGNTIYAIEDGNIEAMLEIGQHIAKEMSNRKKSMSSDTVLGAKFESWVKTLKTRGVVSWL